jgi:voltage-gated potassium channel
MTETSKSPVTTDERAVGFLLGEHRIATYLAVALGVASVLLITTDPADGTGHWLILIVFGAAVLFFVYEWIARLVAAWHDGRSAAYVASASGLVDLASALAVPAAIACGVEIKSASLFGILWLLKPARDIPGLRQLRRVLSREAGPLSSVLVLFLIVLFMAAAVVYVLERDAQPKAFGSLPAALWWAVVTLTTTGYGDVVPMTLPGRLVAALLMISGLGVFGLWTGILATGFAAENRRHNFIKTSESLSKVPFFSALGPATLADVTQMLRRVDLRSRTVVIRKNDSGDCMYFVADGEVEVDLPGKLIRLGVGSFFGELALLGANNRRSATVSTTRSSTLLVLDLIDFHALMARHPELAKAIDEEAKRRAAENASITTNAPVKP